MHLKTHHVCSVITMIFLLISCASVSATFSIVAYDPEVEEWGVAVQSKFLAVGSAVPFAATGKGAVATQAWGNMSYGPEGLTLLEMNISADSVVKILTEKDENFQYRQLGVVDQDGLTAAFTGAECQAWAGHKTGKHYTVQGNILTGEDVVDAMAGTFETTKGSLAERMLAALDAGQQAGGDSRGRQSAAILVVRRGGGYSGLSDRAVDLRVDDHPEPIKELMRIYHLHKRTFGLMSYMNSFKAFKDEGKITAAAASLERSVRLAESIPDIEPAYLNAVAWTLAEENRELKRGLDLARRAVDRKPEDANILDTLATLLYLNGEIKEAIEMEKSAIEHADADEQVELFQKKLSEWVNRVIE
jgi:uncharacterized Ntn-hydrolase superfamily protein